MTKTQRTDKKLNNYLAGFDKEGLTALILELAKELPEVRQALNDRLLFTDGGSPGVCWSS
ncbi:hypothetical protein [Endothiovibrio diazotrophicus]